jgi:hypothetical protein
MQLNLWQLLLPHDNKVSTSILLHDDARIKAITIAVTATTVFLFMILPILGIYQITAGSAAPGLTNVGAAMGLLGVSTLAFVASLSIEVNLRGQEAFALGTAYCAVVVIFASNFGAFHIS